MRTPAPALACALALAALPPVSPLQAQQNALAPGRYSGASDAPAAPIGEGSRDNLKMQEMRKKAVKTMGQTVYRSVPFDLSGLPPYVPEAKVSGKLRIWGLNYMGDCGLNTDWEAGFRKHQPDVSFEYNLPTALIAFSGVASGQADIAASRPITRDEWLLWQRVFDSNPLAIKMCTGSYDTPGYAESLVIAVRKDNPLEKLTLKQLDGIFGAERSGGSEGPFWHPEAARGPEGNIRTWGQLGLTGQWADQPIHCYVPAITQYKFALVFEKIVFHGGGKWNENIREYSNYAGADGKQVLQDAQILADLDQDRYGMALTTFSRHLTPKTKALAIASSDNGPYAAFTPGTIQDGSYPLAYNEWWYVVRKPGRPLEPRIREYLKFVLSREGQEAVDRTGKFNPLTAAMVREEMKKLGE